MIDANNISVLKKSCVFTLEVIELYNELLLNGKKPIAERMFISAISGSCSLQKSMQTSKKRECKEAREKAVIHFKNVIYWIEQCMKSGYWFDENLIGTAIEILEFCENEEPVH